MLDKARKVQSVAFDTNVIIDLPNASELTPADESRLQKIQQEEKLTERDRSYFSYQALMVCRAQKEVETPFIEMVYKELARTPKLQDAYEELFQKKARIHGLKKDIKWLSEKYSEKASLGREGLARKGRRHHTRVNFRSRDRISAFLEQEGFGKEGSHREG